MSTRRHNLIGGIASLVAAIGATCSGIGSAQGGATALRIAIPFVCSIVLLIVGVYLLRRSRMTENT